MSSDGYYSNENGGMNHSSIPNGVVQRNSTPDAHFRFFKMLCDRANEYYVVQKAKGVYSTTKRSVGILERTLDNIEGRVTQVAHKSAPYYEHYVFPATDRLLGYYTSATEKSNVALDRTKSAAVTTGTLGLGLALVATQMGLIVGTAATNMFLDGVIATKNAGGAVIAKGMNVEKAVEQQVINAIHATNELAKNPTEKLNEHANTFLDIANTVFERILGLPVASENPEAGLRERVGFLAQRIVGGLGSQANTNIIEPCHRQMNAVLEQLSKGLILVDYVRKQKEWTTQKVDKLSSSVQDFKSKIETEARQACTTPETALVRSIRHSSFKLNEQLLKLRVNAAEILSESMRQYLESATAYVEQLDLNFANAEDIYKVKDEVVEEAKQKLHEITQCVQWSTQLIVRQQNGTQQNGH